MKKQDLLLNFIPRNSYIKLNSKSTENHDILHMMTNDEKKSKNSTPER